MEDQGEKKVLVLSCGRPMGNCEILSKEACIGAEEAGAKTEILRLHDFKIKPCTGCETCSMSLSKGEKARCVIRDDDADFLLQKILYEDAALIVSSPVFFLAPPGYLKVLNDRFIPYLLNKPDLFLNKRVGASISVGGGEPSWTPLGISMTNLFLLYTRVIVDQQLVNFVGRPGLVTLNEKVLKRARELGRHVAIAANMPIDEVRFMGEELENSCPVCHVNIVQIGSNLPRGVVPESGYFDLKIIDEPGVMRKSPPDASHVVCPNCDVWGKLEIQNGKIKVIWDDESVKHHRLSKVAWPGHFELIRRIHLEAYKQEEKVKENQKKYRSSGTVVKPPRQKA